MFNFAGLKKMLFPEPLPPLTFHNYGDPDPTEQAKPAGKAKCLVSGSSGPWFEYAVQLLGKATELPGDVKTKDGTLVSTLWGSSKVDSNFKKIVEVYQEKVGFTGSAIDGIIGPNTWKKLGVTDAEKCPSSSSRSSSSSKSPTKYDPKKNTGENQMLMNILKYGGISLAVGLGAFFIYKGFTAGKKSNPKKAKKKSLSPLFKMPSKAKKTNPRRLKKLRRNAKSAQLSGRRRRGPRIGNKRKSSSVTIRRKR